jgi:rRNA-processing protein FCF1
MAHVPTSKTNRPDPYVDRLKTRLTALEQKVTEVIDSSTIKNVDPNRRGDGSIFFIGAVRWGWGESDASHERLRMAALAELREAEPIVRLLFPHPVPKVAKKIDNFFGLVETWLLRKGSSHSIPPTVPEALEKITARFGKLRDLLDGLPADEHPVRLVVDTNALIDVPDLSVYTDQIGRRYRAHLMPVVLGELDDLKRSGRTPELRAAASKAGRYLKGLRTNGNPLTGVKVAGDISVVFAHTEPKGENLPGWLDLEVPDDRFVASVLLLQSAHPGASVFVATSDINLQTKLSAVGVPFVEPPN